MGLDSGIKKYIQEHLDAWIPTKDEKNHRVQVEISDILTVLHSLGNPFREWSRQFTGRELYLTIRRMVLDLIKRNGISVYIICMDYQPHVPHRKHKTQSKRSSARDIDKYTQEVVLCDDGIRSEDTSISSSSSGAAAIPSTSMEADAKSHVMDLDRILATRSTRGQMWDYISQKFAKDEAIPNFLMIFDYNHKVDMLGTHKSQVAANGAQPMMWSLKSIETPLFQHRIGESDIKALFWLRVFHRYKAQVRSVDGDMLPLMLQFVKSTQPDRPAGAEVFWKQNVASAKKTTKTLVNISRLMDLMHGQLKWNTEEFLLACILCGSDFFDKQKILAGVGILYIMYGVQQSRDDVKVLLDHCHDHTEHDDSKQVVDAFYTIIRRIYTYRVKFARVSSLKEEMKRLAAVPRDQEPPAMTEEELKKATKKWKRMSIPTLETVSEMTNVLLWHLHYWTFPELNHNVNSFVLLRSYTHTNEHTVPTQRSRSALLELKRQSEAKTYQSESDEEDGMDLTPEYRPRDTEMTHADSDGDDSDASGDIFVLPPASSSSSSSSWMSRGASAASAISIDSDDPDEDAFMLPGASTTTASSSSSSAAAAAAAATSTSSSVSGGRTKRASARQASESLATHSSWESDFSDSGSEVDEDDLESESESSLFEDTEDEAENL